MVQVYINSSIYRMKKSEKLIKSRPIVAQNQQEGTYLGQKGKIDRKRSQHRSQLKFSRKNQSCKNDMTDYRKQYKQWQDQKIHYIARQSNCLQSPAYHSSKLMNPLFYVRKFQAPLDELLQKSSDKMLGQSLQQNQYSVNLNQKAFVSLNRVRDEKISFYKMKVWQLQQDIGQLRNENQLLKIKVNDFDTISQFMMEREAYISEITEKNLKSSEELQIWKNKMDELLKEEKDEEKQFQALRHQLSREQDLLLKSVAKISTQKTQFQMIIKQQLQFSEQIQKDSQQGNIFTKKSIDINRHSPKRYPKLKCLTTKQSFSSNLQKNEIQIKSNEYLPPHCCFDVNNDQQFTQTESADLTRKGSQVPEKCDLQQFEKLRQKIRYYQIQIDILKRIKMNSNKLIQDNDKLRKQNRKLLRRIDFICQSLNSKDHYSDSELQLSLSPKRC